MIKLNIVRRFPINVNNNASGVLVDLLKEHVANSDEVAQVRE